MKGTTRAILTAAFGLFLGILFWLDRQEPSPYALVHSTPFQVFFLAMIVIVPPLVGRWWVVLALAGPLAFLAYWQVTGHHVNADGQAPPLNVESIAGFVWLILLFWLLVGARKVWDGLRRWRTARSKGRIPDLVD